MAEMKRHNSKKQQNIILKQQKTMEKEANWHKTGNEETIQITEKDIMDMINKLEEQAFMRRDLSRVISAKNTKGAA